MYICICKQVSYHELFILINLGMTIEEISEWCGAGTNCGTCLNYIKKLIEEKRDERKDVQIGND